MPVDWKAPEATGRLLAAIIASLDNPKLDLRRIATLFGDGATYDSIENRMRVVKKEARKLGEEVGDKSGVTTKKSRPKRKASDEEGDEGRGSKKRGAKVKTETKDEGDGTD